MKKYISVIGLAARSIVYKLLLIIAATSAAQTIAFVIGVGKYRTRMDALYQIVDGCGIHWIAEAGFIVLCAALCLTGCNRAESKVSLLVQRLRISERTLTLEWAAFNTLCFVIFWASQVITLLMLGEIYVYRALPQNVNTQTILFASYFSDYWHNLLPLQDWFRIVRNIAMAIGLGLATATFSFKQRRGKKPIAACLLCTMAPIVFTQSLDVIELDLLIIVIGLPIMIISAVVTMRGKLDEDVQEN